MANPHPSVKGRKRGVRNKASIARIERVELQGRKLPPENLLLVADLSMGMAGRYQPEITDPVTGGKGPNPNFVEERYAFWLGESREALKAAAPYYAPWLTAVAIQNNMQVEEQGHADPRQVMWEIYKQMRERGELGLKALAPPPAKANGGESRPESVEQPMREDDGDCVAA
jgi:hypothetical protein